MAKRKRGPQQPSGLVTPGELVVETLRAEGRDLFAIAISGRTVIASGDETLASTDGRRFHRRAHPWPKPPIDVGRYGRPPIADGRVRALVEHEGVWYAAGDNVLARSADRAATWKRLDPPARVGTMCTAVFRAANRQWWMGFRDGALATSRQLEQGWRAAPVRHTGIVSSIDEFDDRIVIGGGDDSLVWDGKIPRVENMCRIVRCSDGSWLGFHRFGRVYRAIDGGKLEVIAASDRYPARVRAEACAWVAGALFVLGNGQLVRWADDRFEWMQIDAQLTGIASWGDGALLCGLGGRILRLASPRDPFWQGAADELAPQLAVEPARPREVVRADGDELLREVAAEHAERSAPLRAAHPRDELAALVDADEPDALRVYIDQLAEQGDPRAELAAIQLAIEDRPDDEDLREAEAALRVDEGDLLGPLATVRTHLHELTWRAGFVTRVNVDALEVIETVLDAPACKFLRDLTVHASRDDYNPLVRAVAARYLPALKRLAFGCQTARVDIEPLYPALPNVESLSIRAALPAFGEIVLPKVTRFTLATQSLVIRAAKAIALARWPSLVSLDLEIGARRRGGTARVKDLRALFDATGVPRLVHLAINSTEITDELVDAIARSALLPQLQTLDLRTGTLSDDGARILYRHQLAFAHLARIRLDDNVITADGRALLAGVQLKLELGTQRPDPGPAQRQLM